MNKFMRVVLYIGDRSYETYDVSENIGGWIGRIMTAHGVIPHIPISIQVY